MRRYAIVLAVVACAQGLPAVQKETGVVGSILGAFKDCIEGDVSLCLKEKALECVTAMTSARDIDLADGVKLVGTGSPRSARALELLPDEPKAREAQVENMLIDSTADLLENRVMQLRMPSSAVEGMKRALGEARGKKKKLKQLIPLLALAKIKIMALVVLFLGMIAFAAVKGLMLAKVSLLVAGIIALKKLLAHKHHESYEVVAHPHHEEHIAASGHGWGRSADDAQDLAYSGHIKE